MTAAECHVHNPCPLWSSAPFSYLGNCEATQTVSPPAAFSSVETQVSLIHSTPCSDSQTETYRVSKLHLDFRWPRTLIDLLSVRKQSIPHSPPHKITGKHKATWRKDGPRLILSSECLLASEGCHFLQLQPSAALHSEQVNSFVETCTQ